MSMNSDSPDAYLTHPIPHQPTSRHRMRTIALIGNIVFVLIWLPALFSIQLDQAFGTESINSTSGGWIALSVLLFALLLVPVMGFNLAYLIYWIKTRKRDAYLTFHKLSTAFLILVPAITVCAVTLWIILSILLIQAFEHSTQSASTLGL